MSDKTKKRVVLEVKGQKDLELFVVVEKLIGKGSSAGHLYVIWF